MRFGLLLLAGWIVLASTVAASEVDPITLVELEKRATHIVLGKVAKVVEKGDMDEVTIDVASLLKGTSEEKSFTFTLVTRGGIKDFDPTLKVGASGVFFLRAQDIAAGEKPSEVYKAYWGSMATFSKDFFK